MAINMQSRRRRYFLSHSFYQTHSE